MNIFNTNTTAFLSGLILLAGIISTEVQARNQKPILHGKNWVVVSGKPLSSTAGAMIFQKGGNAIDAAAATLAAACTMWDTLSWGGETQALIYHPQEKRVIGLNALGVAPSGATAEYFKSQGHDYPPGFGPLAAVTPGTPGGLMTMLAEWGSLSLAEVLAPAIEMAEGYPIEAGTVHSIYEDMDQIVKWPASKQLFLTHEDDSRNPLPRPGEIFRQPDLARTLIKLVEAEAKAIADGKNRKQAIYAAYDRFYRGDIAEDLVNGIQELGGLISRKDLDRWQVHIEEPLSTTYKGIEVFKLQSWTQGPVFLQMLNMLEEIDLNSMGYNSSRYIHTLYQVMNLAFADRDFYYGDPRFPPEEPMAGLLSRAYAKDRVKLIPPGWNRRNVQPGDPYPYQNATNPFSAYLDNWQNFYRETRKNVDQEIVMSEKARQEAFLAGTTSLQAADAEGWVISVTPSGGWIPAVVAGTTGIGMSQRMQSFVLNPDENPFNVVAPGKRPRVTLTPTLALKNGSPYLAFSVQGGDTQEQNLLQFLINVVDWGMDPQEASEAANINSYQMRGSFEDHPMDAGRLELRHDFSPWVIKELEGMGYSIDLLERTSGPITAIWFDQEHGTLWGASSNHGDDYGIAW